MDLKAIKESLPGDVLHDDNVRGLHLRVFDNRRSFYLFYRTKAGKQRRPKLGDWPSITLAQAREAAREILTQVAMGKDPSAENQAERTAPTLADLWELFWKDRASKKKSAHSDELRWGSSIEPKLGREKVKDLKYQTIQDWHKAMEKTPYQANRALALLSTMLGHAETLEWRPLGSNPCKRVARFREFKRKRYMRGEEAAKISELLHVHGETSPPAVAFIYLLVMTGARKSEIAKAKWSQIQGNKIVLEEHKTDGNGEDRTIYLPPAVLDLLDKLPRTSGTITGISDPSSLWKIIRKEAECPDLRLHDLRHSFASAALSAGLSLAQIGELLGHKAQQTTKRYTHLIEEAAHEAASLAVDRIQGMMLPKEKVA